MRGIAEAEGRQKGGIAEAGWRHVDSGWRHGDSGWNGGMGKTGGIRGGMAAEKRCTASLWAVRCKGLSFRQLKKFAPNGTYRFCALIKRNHFLIFSKMGKNPCFYHFRKWIVLRKAFFPTLAPKWRKWRKWRKLWESRGVSLPEIAKKRERVATLSTLFTRVLSRALFAIRDRGLS